jgi:cytoskeletal protein CcmA (bactofilin family)
VGSSKRRMPARLEARGSALIWALLVTLVVVAIGGVYLAISTTRAAMAQRAAAANQAVPIADSALSVACRYLFVYRETGSWDWNDILMYNQAFPVDPAVVRSMALEILRNEGVGGREASTTPEAPVPPDPVFPTTQPPIVFGVHTLLNRGSWFLVARNNPDDPGGPTADTDRTLVLHIFATHVEGHQLALEATVRYEPPRVVPEGAILSRGGLRIVGNPRIFPADGLGAAAGILVEGDVEIAGDPEVQGAVEATGQVVVRGNPDIRDGVREGAPPLPAFDADPERYRELADAILHADGLVSDREGRILGIGSWRNLRFSGGAWRSNGADPPPPPGVLFFETDLRVTHGATFDNTIIAKGSVDLQIPGPAGAAVQTALGNISILAGGDVRVRGRVRFRGFVVAREGIDIDGTVELKDSGLLALNRPPRLGRHAVQIAGNVTIEYRSRLATFLESDRYSLRVLQVRRLSGVGQGG